MVGNPYQAGFGGFLHHRGTPIAGWFIMENTIKTKIY